MSTQAATKGVEDLVAKTVNISANFVQGASKATPPKTFLLKIKLMF